MPIGLSRLEVALNAQAAFDGVIVIAEVRAARIEVRVENFNTDIETRNRRPDHVRSNAPFGEVEARSHLRAVLDAGV